jgi:hypothetical protein
LTVDKNKHVFLMQKREKQSYFMGFSKRNRIVITLDVTQRYPTNNKFYIGRN